MFSVVRKVGSQAEPCDRQRFNEIIDDKQVSLICEKIYLAMIEYRAARTEDIRKLIKNEEIAPLKKKLPGFCFLANFPSGHRCVADAVASGLAMVDLDGIEYPRKVWEEIELQARELGAVLAHVTPSTMGLRIVFRVPKGMTVTQAKHWFEMKLQLQNADPAVKDLSRISFAVPRKYFLYLDEEALFAEPLSQERYPDDNIDQTSKKRETVQPRKSVFSSTPTGSYSMDFKGIPYSTIISRLLFAMGVDGAPVEGERNTTLYKLARELRYICDFNVNHLVQVIPHWGLSEEEVRLTVNSALSTVRSTSIPPHLARIIKECEAEIQAASEIEMEMNEEYRQASVHAMQMPELPRLFQLLVKPYPEDYHAAVVMAALPILGTLATKVRAKYIDGNTHSLSFISCIVAPQASGKSFTRSLTEKLLCKVMAQDDVAREIERQYLEQKKVMKNANKLPEDPRVKIRILPPLCSNAMLFKRLDCAQGEHCFSFVEEIDSLTKGQKAGSWCQKDDLLRQAFDNSVGGQDYLSETSWSAMVKIYYNLLMCGTPSAVKRFFSDVENGLVSRVCFVQLPDMLGAPIPVVEDISVEEEKEVQDWVTMLMDEENPLNESLTNGTIHYDVPRIHDCINEWLEARRREYLETQDNPALDIFRRRSAVIGFRAGILAMLLCNHEETEQVLNFAQWVASFVLTQQLYIFGRDMNAAMNNIIEPEPAILPQTISMVQFGPYGATNGKITFRALPDEFDTQMLIQLRRETGFSTRVNMILSRWRRSGWIEKIGNNRWKKNNVVICHQ